MSAPVDPQMLAAMANGNSAEPPMVPVSLGQVQDTLLRAIEAAAQKAATEDSGAEAKDWLQAAKNAADAYVVLDPAVDGTGVPVGHQIAMEQVRQDGALRLEEARAKQNAPAQKRRRLRVIRDNEGRVAGAEED